MAWIESHQSLGRHPKTKAAARALGISRVQLVGHLQYLWWWALDFAEDGDLGDIPAEDIAEEAMWEGDPQQFIDALTDAGFMTPDGYLNDWSTYTGRIVAQREANRKRQQRFRDRQRDESPETPETTAESVTEALPNDGVTVTSPLRNGATVPNQTKPNQTSDADASQKRANGPARYPEPFERFWAAYPSGHGVKKTSYEQWRRLKPDDATVQRIMAGLDRWKSCDRWQAGFVKSAHVWLRERWWENEPPPSMPTPNSRASPNNDLEAWRRKHGLGDTDDTAIDVQGVAR